MKITLLLNILARRIIICFATLAFFVFTSEAQVCTHPASTIFSLSNSGTIYPVAVSNAAVGAAVNSTSLGSTTSANAIGYNPLNGLFYYFQNAVSGSQKFVSYNPVTATYTTLASSPITGIAYKGCVSFNGTGYYCLDSKGNLCYYNIPANSWTLIGSSFVDQYGNNVTTILNSEPSGDIAIDGLGNMWIISSSATNYGLYKLSAPLPTTPTASIKVNQLIAPTTPTPAGIVFVGIAFDPLGNIYMATNNDLYLLSQTSYSLSHIGAFSTAGICGDLTSCNFPFAVLPVRFSNFNVSVENNKSVMLSWEATQQSNNKGFFVEESVDGISWSDKTFIAAVGANSMDTKYSFVDDDPLNGESYYRIKQIDLDGNERFSDVKAVAIVLANGSKISVWPNPARSTIRINNNSKSYAIARVYNQSGSEIGEHRLNSGLNSIDISSLSFGVYIVNVKFENGETYNQKIIKE